MRIDDEVSAQLKGIPKSAVFSTVNYRLDDELYMLMSEGSQGPNNDARSSLYRIKDDTAELALTIWGLQTAAGGHGDARRGPISP